MDVEDEEDEEGDEEEDRDDEDEVELGPPAAIIRSHVYFWQFAMIRQI